jgi:hypothetical protein
MEMLKAFALPLRTAGLESTATTSTVSLSLSLPLKERRVLDLVCG